MAALCQLCDVGSTMMAPGLPIVGYPDFASCGGIDQFLATNTTDAASCTAARTDILAANHDFQDYCQCSGYTGGPNVCTFCTLVDTSNDPHPQLGGLTCTEFANFAAVAETDIVCNIMLGQGRQTCCTEPGDCSLCDDGSAVNAPSRTIPLLFGFNCSETDMTIRNEFTDCTDVDELTPGFDLQAYCMCDGATKPDSCVLCQEPGEGLINPSRSFTIEYAGGEHTMTCADAFESAMYMDSTVVCNQFSQLLSSSCCGMVQQTTEPPTGTPVRSPTSGPTATPVAATSGPTRMPSAAPAVPPAVPPTATPVATTAPPASPVTPSNITVPTATPAMTPSAPTSGTGMPSSMPVAPTAPSPARSVTTTTTTTTTGTSAGFVRSHKVAIATLSAFLILLL